MTTEFTVMMQSVLSHYALSSERIVVNTRIQMPSRACPERRCPGEVI